MNVRILHDQWLPVPLWSSSVVQYCADDVVWESKLILLLSISEAL